MPNNLSALIIFELLQPYAREITTVLAVPEGLTIRFRFKRRWFAPDDPLAVVGTRGLIALRITPTAHVFPLRYCRVIEVTDIGDIFYVVVTAEGFVELHSGTQGQTDQLTQFNQNLAEGPFLGIQNPPGLGMDKLVFLGPSFADSFGNPLYTGSPAARQIAAWGVLVERLIRIDEFLGLDFLHVFAMDFRKSASLARIIDGEFRLTPNRYYKLKLIQRRSTVEPVKTIALAVDESTLTPVLERQLAVGGYDILEFSFYAGVARTQEQRSSMVIKAECDVKDAALFPPFTLPVVIPAKSLLWKLVPIFLFFTAAAAVLVPRWLELNVLGRPLITPEVTNLALIVMIVTSRAVGSFGGSLAGKAFQIWK